jgi:hypothetical protein
MIQYDTIRDATATATTATSTTAHKLEHILESIDVPTCHDLRTLSCYTTTSNYRTYNNTSLCLAQLGEPSAALGDRTFHH